MDLQEILGQVEKYPATRLVKNGHVTNVLAYDTLWPVTFPANIELACYRANLHGNAYEHLKRAHDLIWPQETETWHRWSVRRFRAHCENFPCIGQAGGSNIGKSHDCAKLALLFWLANPKKRTVLVASTSLTDLDSRIWGYIKRLYYSQAAIEMPGRLFTSHPSRIVNDKADSIHGIFAVPLQKGAPEKVISNLIGRHPDEGMLLIVDEGTDVSPHFIRAIANLEKAPFFQMWIIGNSSSVYDPHGLLCTPKHGWTSIDPDVDREWETVRGVCLYFDCYDSPAMDPDISDEKRKALSRFLFTAESIADSKSKYGEGSPDFWRFTRGFWPPEDEASTLFTPVMVEKFHLQKAATWSGHHKVYRLAGCDPAFSSGGDACILRFAELSQDWNDKWLIDFKGESGVHRLTIDAMSSEPAEYQIVEQIIRLCDEAGVEPGNFAVDVQGTGMGLSAVLKQMWSDKYHSVFFSGPATDLWIDMAEEKKAKDIYDRRVTELWFSILKFAQSGQLRGLDSETINQLCSRLYGFKGKKYSIEPKGDYKSRLGTVDRRYKSPDHADAAALIVDLVRQRYDIIPSNYAAPVEERGDTVIGRFIRQMGEGEVDPHVRVSDPSAWADGFLTPDEFVEGGF